MGVGQLARGSRHSILHPAQQLRDRAAQLVALPCSPGSFLLISSWSYWTADVCELACC